MIISIVEQLATDMSLAFYHGREDFQNLIADEQTLPALYLDQPITTDYNLSQSGYTSATFPIKLMFLYKSELDYTPTEHDTNCIQPAEAKIREFINRAELLASIDTITNISSFEFINIFDCNVSGKSLNVTFQINNSYSTCADAGLDLTKGIVTNSDASYNNEVGMGNTLVLADVSITDSDGTIIPTPAMTDFVCTAGISPSGIAYQRAGLTNQQISYYNYDDAWHLANGTYDYTPPTNPLYLAELDTTALNPFETLKNNNAFGNLNRFTDIDGLQVYADSYIIDHLTGYGWNIDRQSLTWEQQLDYANGLTQYTFSDYRVPNAKELYTITSSLLGVPVNYTPFNLGGNMQTSTTRTALTTTLLYLQSSVDGYATIAKTTVLLSVYVRNHYT